MLPANDIGTSAAEFAEALKCEDFAQLRDLSMRSKSARTRAFFCVASSTFTHCGVYFSANSLGPLEFKLLSDAFVSNKKLRLQTLDLSGACVSFRIRPT